MVIDSWNSKFDYIIGLGKSKIKFLTKNDPLPKYFSNY